MLQISAVSRKQTSSEAVRESQLQYNERNGQSGCEAVGGKRSVTPLAGKWLCSSLVAAAFAASANRSAV